MIYRHGDLCIKSIKAIPEGAKEVKTNILARGEVTGHAHRLIDGDYTVYEKDGVMHFRSGVTHIDHEEHGVREIAPDTYIVEREQEFDPFEEEMRRVGD